MKPLRRITFIRPNIGDFRSADAMTPLAFAVLSAATPRRIERRLIDERLEPIADQETDLVALTVETFTARRAYEIAARYRRRGTTVVMGGYHPTLCPDEAQRHADAIVIGDAEDAWARVVADAEAGHLAPVYRAPGIRDGSSSVAFDRSIFAGKRYAPLNLVLAGRGCRFACDFCSIHAFYGNGTWLRPIEEIVAEIRTLPRAKPIFFVDDNLFSNRAAFVGLLEALVPLGIRWCAQITIDVARDDELLDLMERSGCFLVLIGFESLERDNLKQMGKRWNHVAGPYPEVIARLHRRGIMIYGTFVFGYDADGPDCFDRAAEFARDMRLCIANFNPLTPMPGTRLFDRLCAEGRLIDEAWWLRPDYRYGQAIFEPYGMTKAELAEGCMRARRKFYGTRSIMSRALRIGDPWKLSIMLLANAISRREIHRKQNAPLGTGAATGAIT